MEYVSGRKSLGECKRLLGTGPGRVLTADMRLAVAHPKIDVDERK
jgi:hypothetical protein